MIGYPASRLLPRSPEEVTDVDAIGICARDGRGRSRLFPPAEDRNQAATGGTTKLAASTIQCCPAI